ncbi:MAG: HAMP domain-containing protein [Melioribacteraceae bacterium]|nr:HAMP domain-containing protein [Melioribacteraceae bacterium]
MHLLKGNKILIRNMLSFGLVVSIGGLIGIVGLFSIHHIINLKSQTNYAMDVESFSSTVQFLIIGLMLTGTGIAVWSGFFIIKKIQKPLRELVSGTIRMMKGEKDVSIRVFSKDEIGELSEEFNKMSEEISMQLSYLENLPKPMQNR